MKLELPRQLRGLVGICRKIKLTVEKIKDKKAADDTESQSKEPNTTVGTTSKI